MLEVSGLRIRYRGFEFGPVSFSIKEGEFLSLIGTNGSGKSTLIRAILGLNDRVVAGSVTYYGESTIGRPPALFSTIGYVSDSNKDVLPEFTATEYWDYCRLARERAFGARLGNVDHRIKHFANVLDFPLTLHRPLSALSLGTSRKAQIIAALLGDPQLLILDEPFIGLDFIASRALEELLRELRDEGVTILASSHDLDLASRLADSVLVLHMGKPVLSVTVQALGGQEAIEPAIREILGFARREVSRVPAHLA